MTETALAEPSRQGPPAQRSPAGLLLNVIAAILAPIFLPAAGNDPGLAHAAAMETVNAYRARNHMDLIAVGQVIAFGLAVLDSLSLAITEDISIDAILRLRGNASALDRAAEHNRRVLRSPVPEPRAAEPHAAPPQAERRSEAPAPRAVTPQPAPAAAPEDVNAWTAALAEAAAKITAATAPDQRPINQRSPDQRHTHSVRAAALNGSASNLLAAAQASPPFIPMIQPAPRPPRAG